MTEPTLEEMKKAVLGRYPNADSHQEHESGAWGIFVRITQTYSETLWFSTEEMAWSNAYSKSPTKAQPAPESEDEATPLPVEEKFTIYLDGDGDYIMQANRDAQNEFLAAHGATPDEAVLNMRRVLDLNARARLSAGGK